MSSIQGYPFLRTGLLPLQTRDLGDEIWNHRKSLRSWLKALPHSLTIQTKPRLASRFQLPKWQIQNLRLIQVIFPENSFPRIDDFGLDRYAASARCQ